MQWIDGRPLEEGNCVALPVGVSDTLIGSVGVFGAITRMTQELLNPIGEKLVEEFSRISGSLARRVRATR